MSILRNITDWRLIIVKLFSKKNIVKLWDYESNKSGKKGKRIRGTKVEGIFNIINKFNWWVFLTKNINES